MLIMMFLGIVMLLCLLHVPMLCFLRELHMDLGWPGDLGAARSRSGE